MLGVFIEAIVTPKQSNIRPIYQKVFGKLMVQGVKHLKYDDTFHFELKNALPAIGFVQNYANIMASRHKCGITKIIIHLIIINMMKGIRKRSALELHTYDRWY